MARDGSGASQASRRGRVDDLNGMGHGGTTSLANRSPLHQANNFEELQQEYTENLDDRETNGTSPPREKKPFISNRVPLDEEYLDSPLGTSPASSLHSRPGFGAFSPIRSADLYHKAVSGPYHTDGQSPHPIGSLDERFIASPIGQYTDADGEDGLAGASSAPAGVHAYAPLASPMEADFAEQARSHNTMSLGSGIPATSAARPALQRAWSDGAEAGFRRKVEGDGEGYSDAQAHSKGYRADEMEGQKRVESDSGYSRGRQSRSASGGSLITEAIVSGT